MRIFLFFIFFAFNSYAFSQNVLELKNSSTGKVRHLKAGAKLYFKSTNDSDFVKGKIVQIKDTSVVIYCPDYNEDLPLTDLRLDELQSIKKPTTLHAISRSIGSVLLPVGGYLFINGILTLSRDNDFQGRATYDEDLTKSLTIMGGAFVVGGTIPFLIKPKVYNLKGEYTIAVKKLSKE